MKTPIRVLLGVFLAMLALAGPARAAEPPVYTVAVMPLAPPVTMNTLWTPFVERLAKATGLKFRLKHYERMAEFERDIWSGGPDFIFSSPIQVAVAHAAQGYVPIVRARQLVGVGLFVRNDSPVRRLEDLAGKKISFVGNKNVCSVAIQHLLNNQKEKLDFDKEYAGSTRNVIINVLLGKSDAGAIFLPELDREPQDTQAQLRKVVETQQIAPHPLSANPRVPREVRKAVTEAALAMAATPDGAALLKTLNLADPVPADYKRDYSSLDEIDIKGLTNWGQ
ncbi:MAG: phosphate/phosphite/phosphonate ABC transporter substrate-binding protein [Ignavibacteria bacterium]